MDPQTSPQGVEEEGEDDDSEDCEFDDFMPEDLQLRILGYTRAYQNLLDAIDRTESKRWQEAARILLNLPLSTA